MRIGFYTAKVYPDNLDPQDIPECTFPISDTKPIGKVMQRFERLHQGCVGCQEPCKMSVEDINYDNSLLVVKVSTPLKTDVLHKVHEEIIKQKEMGVVVLPVGYEALLVPKDIEIQVENGDEI